MAAPTRRSDFTPLLAEGLRDIFFEKFNSRPWEYKQVFKILNSKKAYEEDYDMTGFGVVPIKPEGQAIAYDNPIGGETKRHTHVSYGLGFRITKEMKDDELYGQMNKMPKAMARSARTTIEQTAANVLNYGFVTTKHTGRDGKALFATDHPLLGGGEQSNRAATPSELSMTSLQAAVTAMEATTDDRGHLLAIKPKRLVVPSVLRWTARELLLPRATEKPDTANRDINSLLEEDLSFFVYHYLTSSTAWFLLAPEDDHEILFFWRKQPTTDSDDDFDTGDTKIKLFMRFVPGFSDYKGAYGNAGA